jgi:hypothetical protein
LATTYGQLRCKWNGNLFGKAWTILFPSFQTGFVVAPENLIQKQELFANARPPRRFNTRTNAIELIYEGEIHRLLKKKNILVYKDAIFYTNVLKKILKMLSVLKPTGGLAIWLQFNTVIWFNFQNKRYAMICFCLKPYFIKTKTLALSV